MSNKKSCVHLVEKIIREIDDLPDGSFWVNDVLIEKRYPFPISLNVGNGKAIYITPEISEMLTSFSKEIMDVYFLPHKSNYTNPEWNKITREAFGATLVNGDDEYTPKEDAEAILEVVRNTIGTWIYDIKEREYSFGCHLCNIPDFAPLSIGPVCFEPRLIWLERAQDTGCVSKVSRSRIERAWKEIPLHKRKPSLDQANESSILDTVGKDTFVCSVEIGPAGAEAGLQKALLAARIAMTVIALGWAKPSSALNVMTLTFDRQPFRRTNLVSSQSGRFGWHSSWSYLPGGVTWMNTEDWQTLRTVFCKLFDCAGEVVRYVTHGHNDVSRPKVMEALYQALLWFHEGCREEVDPMAIVKFCSSMEALTCGRKSQGILDLMKARLRVQNQVKLRDDLNRLYRTGRSRTVHGTNDRLGHDWSESRVLAEHLARVCLISCLEWAVQHPQSDDPRYFSKSGT